ncbi:hypothetical protein AMATHDRAFT_103867, partial [Amanita thiersii Skay4041]
TKSNEKEQSFTILPHPAKSNDPADLDPAHPGAGTGGGLKSNPLGAVFNSPGPFIPSEEMASSLEKPLSREELQAKAAALNKK